MRVIKCGRQLTSFVLLRDLDDVIVIVDAEDLHDRTLVGTQPADGLVELLGLEFDRFSH